MSKAFTRESDDAGDAPLPARPLALVPPGAKNYLTPDGAARLREELAQLTARPAPRPAGVEQRLAQLAECLRTAEVVPPPPPPWDAVRFGATVTFREADGTEDTFRIVGAAEADPARDSVSWLAPVAKSLMNARLGERVRLRVPVGEREVEVTAIRYGE